MPHKRADTKGGWKSTKKCIEMEPKEKEREKEREHKKY